MLQSTSSLNECTLCLTTELVLSHNGTFVNNTAITCFGLDEIVVRINIDHG